MFKKTSVAGNQLRDASLKGQRNVCDVIKTYDIAIQRGHVAASDVCAIDGDASMRIQIEHVS